jgi:hypothetical protein
MAPQVLAPGAVRPVENEIDAQQPKPKEKRGKWRANRRGDPGRLPRSTRARVSVRRPIPARIALSKKCSGRLADRWTQTKAQKR